MKRETFSLTQAQRLPQRLTSIRLTTSSTLEVTEVKVKTALQIRIDSQPQRVARLPFASESGLQQFIEDHSKELFGVDVVASARKDGGMIFKIDLLAVDASGRPWIIECKHDLVDAKALEQLQRYRRTLVENWEDVQKKLKKRYTSRLQRRPDPVLVLVGYRYDHSFNHEQAHCLSYKYHAIQFTDDELQKQNPGSVSLHHVQEIDTAARPHPKVCKRIATTERLERLAPKLTKSFWDLDAELQKLEGPKVTVKYLGKNVVRYSTRGRIFAEAVICEGTIQWRITLNRGAYLEGDSDVSKALKALRDAYHQAH